MSKLQIVADENILLLDEFFAPIADITKVNGRNLQAKQVTQADALVLRSTAKVNKALLQDSKVEFVGTCTIGIDLLIRLIWISKILTGPMLLAVMLMG